MLEEAEAELSKLIPPPRTQWSKLVDRLKWTTTHLNHKFLTERFTNMIYLSKATKNFLRDMAERSIKTFFQGMLAVIPTSAVLIQDIHWGMAFSAGALAAALSVITSLASRNVGSKTDASLINK